MAKKPTGDAVCRTEVDFQGDGWPQVMEECLEELAATFRQCTSMALNVPEENVTNSTFREAEKQRKKEKVILGEFVLRGTSLTKEEVKQILSVCPYTEVWELYTRVTGRQPPSSVTRNIGTPSSRYECRLFFPGPEWPGILNLHEEELEKAALSDLQRSELHSHIQQVEFTFTKYGAYLNCEYVQSISKRKADDDYPILWHVDFASVWAVYNRYRQRKADGEFPPLEPLVLSGPVPPPRQGKRKEHFRLFFDGSRWSTVAHKLEAVEQHFKEDVRRLCATVNMEELSDVRLHTLSNGLEVNFDLSPKYGPIDKSAVDRELSIRKFPLTWSMYEMDTPPLVEEKETYSRHSLKFPGALWMPLLLDRSEEMHEALRADLRDALHLSHPREDVSNENFEQAFLLADFDIRRSSLRVDPEEADAILSEYDFPHLWGLYKRNRMAALENSPPRAVHVAPEPVVQRRSPTPVALRASSVKSARVITPTPEPSVREPTPTPVPSVREPTPRAPTPTPEPSEESETASVVAPTPTPSVREPTPIPPRDPTPPPAREPTPPPPVREPTPVPEPSVHSERASASVEPRSESTPQSTATPPTPAQTRALPGAHMKRFKGDMWGLCLSSKGDLLRKAFIKDVCDATGEHKKAIRNLTLEEGSLIARFDVTPARIAEEEVDPLLSTYHFRHVWSVYCSVANDILSPEEMYTEHTIPLDREMKISTHAAAAKALRRGMMEDITKSFNVAEENVVGPLLTPDGTQATVFIRHPCELTSEQIEEGIARHDFLGVRRSCPRDCCLPLAISHFPQEKTPHEVDVGVAEWREAFNGNRQNLTQAFIEDVSDATRCPFSFIEDVELHLSEDGTKLTGMFDMYYDAGCAQDVSTIIQQYRYPKTRAILDARNLRSQHCIHLRGPEWQLTVDNDRAKLEEALRADITDATSGTVVPPMHLLADAERLECRCTISHSGQFTRQEIDRQLRRGAFEKTWGVYGRGPVDCPRGESITHHRLQLEGKDWPGIIEDPRHLRMLQVAFREDVADACNVTPENVLRVNFHGEGFNCDFFIRHLGTISFDEMNRLLREGPFEKTWNLYASVQGTGDVDTSNIRSRPNDRDPSDQTPREHRGPGPSRENRQPGESRQNASQNHSTTPASSTGNTNHDEDLQEVALPLSQASDDGANRLVSDVSFFSDPLLFAGGDSQNGAPSVHEAQPVVLYNSLESSMPVCVRPHSGRCVETVLTPPAVTEESSQFMPLTEVEEDEETAMTAVAEMDRDDGVEVHKPKEVVLFNSLSTNTPIGCLRRDSPESPPLMVHRSQGLFSDESIPIDYTSTLNEEDVEVGHAGDVRLFNSPPSTPPDSTMAQPEGMSQRLADPTSTEEASGDELTARTLDSPPGEDRDDVTVSAAPITELFESIPSIPVCVLANGAKPRQVIVPDRSVDSSVSRSYATQTDRSFLQSRSLRLERQRTQELRGDSMRNSEKENGEYETYSTSSQPQQSVSEETESRREVYSRSSTGYPRSAAPTTIQSRNLSTRADTNSTRPESISLTQNTATREMRGSTQLVPESSAELDLYSYEVMDGTRQPSASSQGRRSVTLDQAPSHHLRAVAGGNATNKWTQIDEEAEEPSEESEEPSSAPLEQRAMYISGDDRIPEESVRSASVATDGPTVQAPTELQLFNSQSTAPRAMAASSSTPLFPVISSVASDRVATPLVREADGVTIAKPDDAVLFNSLASSPPKQAGNAFTPQPSATTTPRQLSPDVLSSLHSGTEGVSVAHPEEALLFNSLASAPPQRANNASPGAMAMPTRRSPVDVPETMTTRRSVSATQAPLGDVTVADQDDSVIFNSQASGVPKQADNAFTPRLASPASTIQQSQTPDMESSHDVRAIPAEDGVSVGKPSEAVLFNSQASGAPHQADNAFTPRLASPASTIQQSQTPDMESSHDVRAIPAEDGVSVGKPSEAVLFNSQASGAPHQADNAFTPRLASPASTIQQSQTPDMESSHDVRAIPAEDGVSVGKPSEAVLFNSQSSSVPHQAANNFTPRQTPAATPSESVATMSQSTIQEIPQSLAEQGVSVGKPADVTLYNSQDSDLPQCLENASPAVARRPTPTPTPRLHSPTPMRVLSESAFGSVSAPSLASPYAERAAVGMPEDVALYNSEDSQLPECLLNPKTEDAPAMAPSARSSIEEPPLATINRRTHAPTSQPSTEKRRKSLTISEFFTDHRVKLEGPLWGIVLDKKADLLKRAFVTDLVCAAPIESDAVHHVSFALGSLVADFTIHHPFPQKAKEELQRAFDGNFNAYHYPETWKLYESGADGKAAEMAKEPSKVMSAKSSVAIERSQTDRQSSSRRSVLKPESRQSSAIMEDAQEARASAKKSRALSAKSSADKELVRMSGEADSRRASPRISTKKSRALSVASSRSTRAPDEVNMMSDTEETTQTATTTPAQSTRLSKHQGRPMGSVASSHAPEHRASDDDDEFTPQVSTRMSARKSRAMSAKSENASEPDEVQLVDGAHTPMASTRRSTKKSRVLSPHSDTTREPESVQQCDSDQVATASGSANLSAKKSRAMGSVVSSHAPEHHAADEDDEYTPQASARLSAKKSKAMSARSSVQAEPEEMRMSDDAYTPRASPRLSTKKSRAMSAKSENASEPDEVEMADEARTPKASAIRSAKKSRAMSAKSEAASEPDVVEMAEDARSPKASARLSAQKSQAMSAKSSAHGKPAEAELTEKHSPRASPYLSAKKSRALSSHSVRDPEDAIMEDAPESNPAVASRGGSRRSSVAAVPKTAVDTSAVKAAGAPSTFLVGFLGHFWPLVVIEERNAVIRDFMEDTEEALGYRAQKLEKIQYVDKKGDLVVSVKVTPSEVMNRAEVDLILRNAPYRRMWNRYFEVMKSKKEGTLKEQREVSSGNATTFHRVGFVGKRWSRLLRSGEERFRYAFKTETASALNISIKSVRIVEYIAQERGDIIVDFYTTHPVSTPEAEVDTELVRHPYYRVWELYGSPDKQLGGNSRPSASHTSGGAASGENGRPSRSDVSPRGKKRGAGSSRAAPTASSRYSGAQSNEHSSTSLPAQEGVALPRIPSKKRPSPPEKTKKKSTNRNATREALPSIH